TGVVMALLLEPVESAHVTYLLTWNPNNWPWRDLEDQVGQTAGGRAVEDRWSCGNTKRIRKGDRLFLLRQGVEPRGIMGSGWAMSPPYRAPHYSQVKMNQGDMALYVDVRFERILNPEVDDILPLSQLRQGPLAEVNWATPASGIQVKQGADELERL